METALDLFRRTVWPDLACLQWEVLVGMRRRANGGTVESSRVVEWITVIQLQVAAFDALIFGRAPTTSTFRVAGQTFARIFVDKVIDWTLIFALLTALVAGTLLADLLMESVLGALLAPWMTLATDRFAGKLLQGSFVLFDALAVVAIWTRLVFHQTSLDSSVTSQDCAFARNAPIEGNGIPGTIATQTGLVTCNTSSVQVVLRNGTFCQTEFTILHVDA